MKRIHQLARELKVDKKVLLKFLQSRGHGVRSASSQIDNISSDALATEFKNISDVEAEMIQGTQAEAIPKREAETAQHTDAPANDYSGKQGIKANDRPPLQSDQGNLNPFNSIPARDWLADALWSNEYPEFENNIILIGDGPFESGELVSFLERWRINSDVIGERPEADGADSGYWSALHSAEPTVFVIGTKQESYRELESLLSDATCQDKPTRNETYPLPYWVEQYLDKDGRSVFFRSKTLRKVPLVSQEMLLAHLFADYVGPSDLGAIWTDHEAAHPVLGKIDELKIRANYAPTFKWPTTVAEVGDGSVDGEEWPSVGLLKYMGYAVGANGESDSMRRDILTSTYVLATLPRIESPEYLRSWGNATSAARLKKMADAIAAFVRNQKRKASPSQEAISDWEEDLDWLKKTYYSGRYDYKFNWPNTRG